MKRSRSAVVVLGVVASLVCAAAAHAVEPYDHPTIGRYEGSSVIHQEASNYSQYTLGLAAARDGAIADTLTVAGKVLMSLYSGPQDASSYEIISAYRALLQSKGFEALFVCEKVECGEKFLEAFYGLAPFANDPGWNHSAPITQGNGEFSYVLVAKSTGPVRPTYVSLIVSQGWWSYPVYKLDVIEVQEQAGKISSVQGAADRPADAGSEEAREVLHRPLQFGLQACSDGYFGLMLCANRAELCLKARAVLYDGFPSDDWPDNGMLVLGTHAAYLLRPADPVDVSLGMDFRYGLTLVPHPTEDIAYKQYIDAGPRIGVNYHLGEHLMVSGVLHPLWFVARETDVDDSYNLTIIAPTTEVAVSLFF